MLSSFLMGLVGGQRSMTPLALVALAAASGRLPRDNGAPRLLSDPLVATGAVALAVAELAGDKMKSAPDRVVPIGLAARFITSAIAGAALAPHQDRWLGAAIGGAIGMLITWPALLSTSWGIYVQQKLLTKIENEVEQYLAARN